MNSNVGIEEPVVIYYDSDYPSEFISGHPENFDEITEYQGVRHDVRRYLEIAERTEGLILEICCGTGRVAIPLARRGHQVTAVDIAAGMLERFNRNLSNELPETRKRIDLIHQDAAELSLDRDDYALAIIAFNSLPCVADAAAQRRTLSAIARHLRSDGLLIVDTVNPLALSIAGQPYAKPFFTRRSEASGNRYTRFAMYRPFDAENRQKIYGWYDEEEPDGGVKRSHYSMFWRPIFKPELELMLATAGFHISALEGGHHAESFTSESPRMFVTARKTHAGASKNNQNGSTLRKRGHGDFV